MGEKSARGRRRRTHSTMWRCVLAAAVLALEAAPAHAVELLFRNECGKTMTLSNGKTTERIQKDSFLKKTLPVGTIEAFRFGMTNQATLAEFSVQEAITWYDIGIIPTGNTVGPGNCSSLAHCKEVTGGTGFNVGMKIVPSVGKDDVVGPTCMTVNCFEDGCPDAYQYPTDPGKTRNCPSTIHFTVVFCATATTGSTDGSLGWNGTIESAVIVSQPPPATTPAPSPSTQEASTSHSAKNEDSTSVVVIIAGIIGGLVAVFAVMIAIPRLRHFRLEKMNGRRCTTNSEAIFYTEARDKGSL